MDFLLKKSWHPSRIQNVEKVWKAEQIAADEDRKMMELSRKLQEEREIEEMRRLQQVSSKSKPRQERVDWMYEGAKPATSAQEYLEGKQYEEEEDKNEAKSNLGLFQGATANAEQEVWNRLREDPLLEMRRQEQKSLEYIKKNPVKMALIKKKLESMRKEEKEEKKSKGDKKRKRKSHKEDKDKDGKKHHDKKKRKTDDTERTENGGGENSKDKTAWKDIREEKQKERQKEWEIRDAETKRKMEERNKRRTQTRNMSSEEKRKLLEEMQADANENDAKRDQRLRRHRADEDKKDEGDTKRDTKINFLNDVKKHTYSHSGVGTLQDRLNRNAHFRTKGNLDELNTFNK